MGEVSDAMMNGDGLCAGCGMYLEWADNPGFPLYCSRACAPDEDEWLLSRDYRDTVE